MKILKGFISSILGFVMLMALTMFCSLFVIRNLLSGPNLAKIFTSVIESTSEVNLSGLTNSDLSFDVGGIDKEFLEEDAMEVYGELFSQMLEYEVGVRNNLPDTKALKEKMGELAESYEKKTGEKIDISEMEDEIDKAVEQYSEESKNRSIFTDEQKKIFEVIYSNTIPTICIVVFIVCAILIVVINKSIMPLLVHLVIILVINGIGNGLLGTALGSILKDNSEVGNAILDSLSGIFNKVLIISIIVAVLLLVAFIIIKVINKKKEQPTYLEQNNVMNPVGETSYQEQPQEQYINPNNQNNNMQ